MGSLLEKNSAAVRKRIAEHTFSDEAGEEYEASEFGGFGDYFRRKKLKLQNLDADFRASAEDKPKIFKGVVAHVMGYTQPSLHVLHKELVQHGAGFLQYLDSKTMATHIIASAIPPKKAVDFNKYRIVKPAWVIDSIKAGKLLPWPDYRVVDESPRQKTIKFDGGKMFTQAAQQPSQLRYREQTQNGFYDARFHNSSDSRSRPSFRNFSGGEERPAAATHSHANIADPDVEDAWTDSGPSNGRLAALDAETPSKSTAVQKHAPDLYTHPEASPLHTSPTKPSPSTANEPPVSPRTKPLTSEEHNARLLSDPRIRKSSTANPEFLKQYYSESRLHHLSTWKAELKSTMQKLAADKGLAAKATKRKPGSRRYVMHVDFDSFFCAVSLRKHPEHASNPAVVAHSTGNGSEIASCNYPAREFGVKNGMWMKRAQELCPDLKILPYDFPAYEEASRLFYEAILEVGGVTQSVSIDEALVDITSVVLSATGSGGLGVDEGSIWREQEKANQIASELRKQVFTKTGCNVSVGIGGSILLAKVALRKAKPAGQHQILPEEVLDVVGELKVEQFPGVAYSISGKLEEIGIRFGKDIRQTSKERLVSVLGPKTGEKLWEYSRGIDRIEVGEQSIRKSVSAEVNWGIRFISQQEAEDFVGNLCKELERRLLNEGVKGKHLTMKIMRRAADAPLDPPKHLGHGKCDTFNKSAVFGVATNNAESMSKEAVVMLRSCKFSPGDLRGLGVQLTKLEPIKPDAAGPDGSQKRLNFGSFATAAPPSKRAKAEVIDEEEFTDEPRTNTRLEADPITDDPITPRKPKVHPALALAKANEADANATTPLNIAGTQFILPSNADPAVLAELPPDIQSKITGKSRTKALAGRSQDPLPLAKAKPQLPLPVQAAGVVPADVDPEVLKELPDDVRAEILASYGSRGGQPVMSGLPQSPLRDRFVHQPKKATTPPARRGIRSMFSRARERQHDVEAGLQQTNFLTSNERPGGAVTPSEEIDQVEELDPEFLAELPEDVRREVVEDHRQRRLAQKARLAMQAPAPQQRAQGDGESVFSDGQARLQFPPKPPKARFTNSGLSSLEEVKDMLNVWHRETRGEGPHRADVEMFKRYLARVVTDERDMDKARRLVSWLKWIVEEADEEGKGKQRWVKVLDSMKETVQEATKARGLGSIDLG